MGLALFVGILADLKKNDPEGCEALAGSLRSVNDLLDAHNLPAHNEPLDIGLWDAEMYGYSGLHYLRRIAAHIDAGLSLPAPGDGQSSDDEILEAYFEDFIGKNRGLLRSVFGRKRNYQRSFDHLIVHSDSDGFYLPLDFPDVLVAPDESDFPGAMLGSTPRLLRECDQLAKLLEIPADLTVDSEELWDAADSQGEGEAAWQRYGVESFTCVALREACGRSLDTGAAIAFM